MTQSQTFSVPDPKNGNFQVVRHYVSDCCAQTTIHGIRYFTEKNRHWTEKCWWIVAVGLAVWFCGASIRDIWIKWRDSPVTMSVTEEMLPISTVPFPTVTICPEVKVYKEKFNLMSLLKLEDVIVDENHFTRIELSRVKALSHVCPALYKEFLETNKNFVDASIFDLLVDMAPDLTYIFSDCIRSYGKDNCSEIMVPILTDEGVCFAYNALNSGDIYTENMASDIVTIVDRPNLSDWSLENGYNDVADKKSYPNHVYSAQDKGSLKFYLGSKDKDVDYFCKSFVVGFKAYLHSPGDVLKSSDVSVQIPFAEQVRISIKPKMITTAEGLRKYKPSQRQCFFNSERRLRFFQFYSQTNCELECLANYTVNECGCVKFSMPRNGSTKICGPSKIVCYRTASQSLFEEDIVDGLSNEAAKSFRLNCNCMPACTSFSYEIDTDRAKYDWFEGLKRALNVTMERETEEMTRISTVTVFFEHHQISTFRREEQYTNTDFLAICGGLLGLCLGVSALSIIELVYYSTVRLIWTLRNRKTESVVVESNAQKIDHVVSDKSIKVLPIWCEK